MSIQEVIVGLKQAGRLTQLLPVMPDDPVKRTLLVSEGVLSFLEGPWQDTNHARRGGRLRADLESFVKGEMISVCLEPFKAGTAYMARLHPIDSGVWDIRSRDPKPGIRVFGGFAERDLFVALLWSPRSTEVEWTAAPPLGDKGSRQWRDARVSTNAEWKKLFNPFDPVVGVEINDYITEDAIPGGNT